MAVARPIRDAMSEALAVGPLLENGDRLTRDEFERRYDAMPDLKKAELIGGVVYVGSPVTLYRHGKPHARLVCWLVTFESKTPGVEVGDNATVRLAEDDEPQPDVFLRILPDRGGQSRDSVDGYVEGAPELVVEIAASSVSLDLHAKKEVCRRAGVREYLVWRVLDMQLDWWILRNEQYVPLPREASGVIHSETFPGLWLDAPALLRGELATVLDVLQQGLQSEQHENFAAFLNTQESV